MSTPWQQLRRAVIGSRLMTPLSIWGGAAIIGYWLYRIAALYAPECG